MAETARGRPGEGGPDTQLAGYDAADATPTVACQDCTATGRDGRLRHDDTCPVGRALDEMQADDREWFAARPRAPWRVRPIHPAEVALLRHAGAVPPDMDLADWRVRVRQLGPGIKHKEFVPGAGR
jgi:hypothetical protein